MRSLLLISILIATVAIPVRAARDASARRGFRRALLQMALFNTIYLLACAFVYYRLP
jgi:hypothetical protein